MVLLVGTAKLDQRTFACLPPSRQLVPDWRIRRIGSGTDFSAACCRNCDNGTVALSATELEGIVANKDKGGKSNKKTPSKNLKEKRQEKKAKRDASDKRQSKIT